MPDPLPDGSRNEAAVWDRFSGIYDAFMRHDMPAYHRVLEKSAMRIRPQASVLEVATGTGILALGLAGSVRRVEAVDLSREMILKARKKARALGITNVRFFVKNAYSLGYADHLFDAVIISNTLHIMPQPEKALSEIRRVLKPDGLLIAPNFAHAGCKKATLFAPLGMAVGFRAYHKWTPESYCGFLSDNGFTVEDVEILPTSIPMVCCCCKPSTQNS